MKNILDETFLNGIKYLIFDIPATCRVLQFNDPWMIENNRTIKYYLSLPRMRFMASNENDYNIFACFLDEEGTYPLILPNVYGSSVCLGSTGLIGVENKLNSFFNSEFVLHTGANLNNFLASKLKIEPMNLLKKNYYEMLSNWEKKSLQNKSYNFIDDNKTILNEMIIDYRAWAHYYSHGYPHAKILKRYFF